MEFDDIVVCRCEEVTMKEILSWVDRGYRNLDELKRVLRVGMGQCQGRGCRDIIMRELARATDEPMDKITPGTIRPPVKPVKLGLCAWGREDISG
ncbi:MAG: (2Fe-2S)-binding protein [Synergistaceae bacterium]|jgi:bacterioferritin-associated ferredoxin|nr:(2Fe-2S)-binding protein [Synergistaceae bacterium]